MDRRNPHPPRVVLRRVSATRARAGLRRLLLKGLRNTSVSLMLAGGLPVRIVAAWHGHDRAVSLFTYSDTQRDGLRADGAALFG